MKLFSSLRNILILNFVLVAILPILVIGFIILQFMTISMEQEITERNFLLAKTLSGEVEQFLNEPLHILEHIEDVIDSKHFIHPDQINAYLDSVINQYKIFDTIMILDSTGKINYLAPFTDELFLLDMSGQDFFRVTKESDAPHWSPTFISPQTGQPTLTLTVPLQQGMVVGYINLSVLNAIIAKIKIGSQGSAMITDNDGTLIAHRNESLVSQRVNVGYLYGIQQGLAGKEGTFEYQFEGVNTLGSVTLIPHTGWLMGVTQPVEESFSSVKRMKNIIAIGTSTALAIAIITALFSLKKTLHPLSQLTEYSQKVTRGDYHVGPQKRYYLEVDKLTQNFHTMIKAVNTREKALQESQEELRKYQEHLEDIVVERTKELEKAKEVAESANHAKSVFLANMSHELRTPLNAVLGYSEILSNREKDPQKKHYLKSVRSSGKSLLSLINNVLDLSKVEAGKLELQYSAVSISSLFNEMKTIFQPQISDKGLEFIIQVADNVPQALVLDETRVRQVLINLLSNAFKFSEQGFVQLSCKIGKIENDSHSWVNLIIEIQDSGKGISPKDQSRIFEVFEQAKGQKISQYGGTGLGLAISRNMIRLMNGSISVESAPEQGSTFWVEIQEVEIATGEAIFNKMEMAIDPETITFEAATILIADDIDYNREMLAAYLNPWTFTLIFATNGLETISQTEKYHPDLILLDMKMPKMDGYEAAVKIKSEKASKDIPIIAVTASVLKQDEETIRQQCDSYLRKPVSQTALIKEMMKFLAYSEKKGSLPPIDGNLEIILPSEEELKTLYEVALDGDMDGITAYLEKLEKQNTNLEIFCKQVRELALDYKDEKIITLLNQYLSKQPEVK